MAICLCKSHMISGACGAHTPDSRRLMLPIACLHTVTTGPIQQYYSNGQLYTMMLLVSDVLCYLAPGVLCMTHISVSSYRMSVWTCEQCIKGKHAGYRSTIKYVWPSACVVVRKKRIMAIPNSTFAATGKMPRGCMVVVQPHNKSRCMHLLRAFGVFRAVQSAMRPAASGLFSGAGWGRCDR